MNASRAPFAWLARALALGGALTMWTCRAHPWFVAGLLAVLLAPLLPARTARGRFSRLALALPWLPVAAAAAHGLWPHSVAAGVVALFVVGGAFPAHLWLAALRDRLPTDRFLLLVLAQPGLALAVHVLDPQTVTLSREQHHLLTTCFLATALLRTGFGLVRFTPLAVLHELIGSQAAMLVAGALASDHGFAAEYLMLAGTNLGGAVLGMLLADLSRRHALDRLRPDHGLASVEPRSCRLFVVAGFLFAGLPGGIVFFAEDLLFHALVQHSAWHATAMVLAAALNAVGFYRLHLGVFAGRMRPGGGASEPPPRGLLAVATLLVAATLLFGCWPQLLLGPG